MLESLDVIRRIKKGERGSLLRQNRWLMHLVLTHERNVNMERVFSMEELQRNIILNYVEKTLEALESLNLSKGRERIIEECLKWSEVAKCGTPHHRRKWAEKGYNLAVHNIGSAQIFAEEADKQIANRSLIEVLIRTHGLIGQYVRGEVNLSANMSLTRLIELSYISKSILQSILYDLNYCIISPLGDSIWEKVENDIKKVIELIVEGKYEAEYTLKERIQRLRSVSIKSGENFAREYSSIFADRKLIKIFEDILANAELWFVEAALHDFSFEEFVKMILMTYKGIDISKIRHISFEYLMKDLYYQHEGKKKVNIYMKRVLEKYLKEHRMEDILSGRYKENLHVKHRITINRMGNTAFFSYEFSAPGRKLIEFCVEAEKSDMLYEKAIILLFDLFDLRRDKFDRFHNEEKYLRTMNQTIDYKRIILDYVVGDNILDVGPGGGALLDLLAEQFPERNVWGIDFSRNVIEELKRRKQIEGRMWKVKFGDALNLTKYVEKGSIGTIIFCAVFHELFSYIEFEGRKFNHNIIRTALKSAYDVLSPGGRIIIRDGIMSEPVDKKVIIQFLSEDGMRFLESYVKDFKGRQVEYEIIGQNRVTMLINNAMEFLYTYTWGEKSYNHEVQEQYGYFTPTQYRQFILKELGTGARIVEFKHYLQEGYTTALAPKIEFFDETETPIPLPDSNCFIVIEKEY